MEKYLPKIRRKPIIEKVPCSLSPEDLYSFFAGQKNTALLNSSLETDAGRFSFIGTDPFLKFKGKGRDMYLETKGHIIPVKKGPFEILDSILGTYRMENPSGLPFSSGGIGYFSYDLKNALEKLPRTAIDDLMMPDIYFIFYRCLIAFDRQDPGSVYISVLDIDGSPEDPSSVVTQIKTIVQKSPDTLRFAPGTRYPVPDTRIISNFTKKEYISAVKKAIDHIRAGDIYQACLSQRFRARLEHDPYEIYLRLNRINPAPFSAYLCTDGAAVLSSSPELFLRYSKGKVETRPMKGTRPRGKNEEKDRALMASLEKSVKDTAELSMIVDLERNDLGKICSPGSIRVKEHRRIEKYPTVYQTISIVEGSVPASTDLTDIIKAAFPGGSITGCPKIRAMEIIDDLEPCARGVYTGSIGYLSFHDTMDLNIAIRTMTAKNGELYFHAGGGITAGSDPEKEYQETLHKARAMMESLS
ncbi:MAG: aminodeoxychorismate synthase component I [Candidatus Omnitrophica bacterium]|nr:aminodeoxychorismate synthase component I [Candidatus Omnitrophota bacterium]